MTGSFDFFQQRAAAAAAYLFIFLSCLTSNGVFLLKKGTVSRSAQE